METYLTFASAEEARVYRHEHGTGGWIFEPDRDTKRPQREHDMKAILFPPHITPRAIVTHPFTRGRSGTLIGNS